MNATTYRNANHGNHPMKAAPVRLQYRAAHAWGLARDVTCAPVGAVLVAADGTALRVTESGALDPVHAFGHRSIASDPTAVRA